MGEFMDEQALTLLASIEPRFAVMTHTRQAQVLGRLLYLHLREAETRTALRLHIVALAEAASDYRTE